MRMMPGKGGKTPTTGGGTRRMMGPGKGGKTPTGSTGTRMMTGPGRTRGTGYVRGPR